MSNYPPGVTGNEPQITGEWRCKNCNAPLPEDWWWITTDQGRWAVEAVTGGEAEELVAKEHPDERILDGMTEPWDGEECPNGCIDEPDPDDLRDREFDRRMEGHDEP